MTENVVWSENCYRDRYTVYINGMLYKEHGSTRFTAQFPEKLTDCVVDLLEKNGINFKPVDVSFIKNEQ